MSKKAIIDVGLRIDVKDQLNAIASEIQSMAKSSSKGISSSMAKEMQAIEDEVNKIKETMNSLAFGKLNARAFDSANKTLMNQIDNLEKRTSALETGMEGLIKTMSDSDGGKMADSLQNVSREMENLRTNTENTISAIKEIQTVAQKTGGNVNFVDTTKDIEALKEERRILKDIKDTVSSFDKGNLSFDLDLKSKTFKEAEKEVQAIYKRMVQLNTQVKSFGKINTEEQRMEFANLQRDLTRTVLMMSDAAVKIDKTFGNKLGPENSIFRRVMGLEDDEVFTQKIDSILNYITKRGEAINTKLSNLGGTNVLARNEKGSIEVPLELTPKGKGLATQAEHIIAVAQRTIDNKPLEVKFRLVSAYSSKNTNNILKQFQAKIDDIEDELKREDFQGLFNQLREDFQKGINIKISADVKDVADKVNTTVKKIREELKEKISIFPTIKIEDDELKKIQDILDDISKSLTLTIGDVALSEKATQKLKAAVENDKKVKSRKKQEDDVDSAEMAKIKELSKSIESVTEGINGQLNEINSGSLQPIVSSLQQIGQLLMVIMQSTTAIPESVSAITSNIYELINVMQRGFGLLTNDELDSKFANIQDRVSKINGDLRGGDKNKRVLELKELVKLYKEYQGLGGRRTIEDLGGAKNVQKWLQGHVNDDVFSDEALGLSKVEESVDGIGKKIDSKNEKFKEEASIVKSVASEETKALKDVVDILQQMFENLAQINQKGFDDWKVEDWRSAISAALSEIDKLNLKDSEGKELGSIKVQVEPMIDPIDFSNRVTNALSDVRAEINVVPSFNPNEVSGEISKLLNAQTSKGNRKTYADIIKEMMDADKLMSSAGATLRERGMLFNTKTGYHTNSYTFSNEKNYTRSLIDALYSQASEEVNAFIHSHPHKSAHMSLGQINEETKRIEGDILAFWTDYNKGIATQIIAAQDEVQIFDAKGFYDKYKNVFNDSNIKEKIVKVHDIVNGFLLSDVEGIAETLKTVDHGYLLKSTDVLPTAGASFTSDNVITRMNSVVRGKKDFRDSFIDFITEESNKKKMLAHQMLNVKNKGTSAFDVKSMLYAYISRSLQDSGEFTQDNINQYLSQVEPKIKAWAEKFYKNFDYAKLSQKYSAKAFQVFDKWNPEDALGITDFDKFVKVVPMDEFVESVKETQKDLGDTVDWSEVGRKIVLDFVSGIESALPEVQSSMNKIADTATKELRKVTEQFEQIGKKATESFVNTQDSSSTNLEGSSQFIGKTAEELQKCLAYEERWLKQCKEGSDAYDKRKTNIEEINALLRQTDGNLGATESTEATKDEGDSFDKISEKAKEASEAKEKFATANKEVLSSIVESVKGLADESKGFESLNKLIKDLSKEDGMENTIKNLQAIADLLKTEVSDSSILSVLKDIAAQGTNLGDLATLIKASRKEIENAKKAVDKAQGKKPDTPEPIVKHNGLQPFANADDIKFINQQLSIYKEELGEVLEVYRKVDGELESFSVKTTKGNTMIFARDSEDQWIASIQRIKDYTEQYKESQKIINSLEGFIDKQNIKIDNKLEGERIQYVQQYREELDKAKVDLEELNAIIQKNQGKDIWSQDDIDRVEELQKAVKETTDNLTKTFNIKPDSTVVDKLLSKINTDINDNSKMTSELRSRFLMLRDAVDEYRNSAEGASKVDFKSLTAEFQHLHEEMLRTQQTGKGFFQSIAEAAKSQTTQFIARYFSLQDWIRYAQQAFEKVKSIDSALTELRKVSDASTSRLAQNFEASSKAAQDLGHSISGVINITADWARLGYSVDDAEKLARITTMFETVGDNMSTETASQYMISTLQGFQLGVDKAEEITDKYNEVANNFAIDTAGIGEALTRSAASFNAANTDLSQAIALVTATNEVVQNPESVGTLWKTLSARIRGASTELQELNEEEDQFTQTTSKLRDLVKSLTGFDIMKDENTYKSIYDIILGIGENWDKLTDIEQASLGEALAGKRNANALFAVLGNLDTLRGAYEKAEDSAGSAAREQANYQKSLQYSLDRTKASLEELSYDLLDSDMLKEGLELINEIIKAVDVLVEHLNPITALLTGGGVLGAKGFVKNFDQLARAGEFNTLLSSYTGLQGATADFGKIKDDLIGLDKAQRSMLLSTTALSAAEKQQALESIGLSASEAALEIQTYSLSNSQVVSTTTTTKLGNALKGAGAGLKAFATSAAGVITIVAAVGVGIVALIKYLDQLDDKARESISNLSTESDGENSKLESMSKELEDVRARIEEINSQGTLTITDQEELQKLQEQNNELERTLGLQKEIAKNANQKVISEYLDNESILNEDFADKYNNYLYVKQDLKELKHRGPSTIGLDADAAAYALENYEAAIERAENDLDEFKGSLLETVSTYEEVRDAIIAKYNGDLKNISSSDSRILDDVSSKIRQVYKSIYSKSEYQRNIIEPFFKIDVISDEISSLFNDFYSGKSIDWESILNSKQYEQISNQMKISGLDQDDLIEGFKNRSLIIDQTRLRLEEVNKVVGNSSERFKELTENINADEWLLITDNMSDFEEQLGLTIAGTNDLSLSFDEAKSSVDAFIKGTDDATSELEDLQNALADTRNMSAETYAALVSHSQKYSNAVSIENGRLVVNRSRLIGIANSRVKEQKETLKQASNYKKLEYLKRFRELKMYDERLVDTTFDTYANVMALQDQITQLDLLSNQLDIASDSFERFKEAQSTENAPDYDTGMAAFTTITEGLNSGKVGTDDFKYAMQALMSADAYKDFVSASKEGYDAAYDFMEKWQKTNAKFFTEDDRENAIAWQKYLTDTGLLQDGMIASSEELGKATGFSYDIVNALNENLNQYSFDRDIITQTQIDYIDEATEATLNLVNARQALTDAEESGADVNLITGLKEDVEKAKADYDAFIADVPEKFNQAKEEVAEGKETNLISAMFGDKEADASAFIETINTQIEDLTKKAEDLKPFSAEGYQKTIEELKLYKDISDEIAHANYQNIINNTSTEDLAKQTRMMENISKQQERLKFLRQELAKASQYGDSNSVTKVQQQIEAIQYSLAEWSNSTYYIDIQIRKDAIENEISALKNELVELQKTVQDHPITVEMGGGYQAQQAMQSEVEKKKAAIDNLEKQKMELETTITYVTDAKEAEETREELSQDINTDLNINIKDDQLFKIEKLKNILSALKEMGPINVSVNATASGNLNGILSGRSTVAPESILQRLGGGVQANGTAHADGDWSLQSNEPDALLGELGPEGLVRDGKFYLIGKKGPERKNLKKGDIIFNHKQTEELLKNGYATERGTLIGSGHALGTILGSAFANANNKMDPVNIRTGSSTVSKAAKQATEDIKDDIDEVEKESEEQTDNFIDWIERRIKHFSTYAERYLNQAQKALDKVTNTLYSGGQKGVKAFKVFDKTIDSLYKTASNSQRDLMEVQQEAYTAYTNLTNAVGLDPEYQNRIKYGLMEIENVTDETLKDQISKYQDYYDKSQEALDNFIEAAEKFYHLPIDKAAEKIENLSNKIEYLGKVSDNTIGYKNKNEILKEQDKQQRLTYKAQKQANKETQKNLKTAKKQAKKETKDQINEQIKRTNAKVKQEKKEVKSKKALASADKAAKKEIKQATKSNKAIDLTKLKKGTKAYKEAKQYNAALTDKAGAKLSKKELKTGNVLNLENFEKGSAAYKAVVKYNAAINAQTEAWNNAKNAEEEYLHWHQVEYPKAAFDNIAADFNHTVEMMNHDFTDYGNQINELVKAGKKVSTGYYRAQKDINALKMEEYVMERNELETQLSQIQRYSDEWYDAYNQIKEVDNQISQLKISTMELNEAMRQLYLDSFQGMRNDIETLIGEQEFLLSLMSHNKKTDNEIGYFTDEGLVNLTSGVATATMAQAKQRNTASEIKELQDLLDKGELKWRDTQFENIDQLKDQIRDLYGTWQSEIKDTYDAQSSIVDLMKERYQAELEMYKDLVSSKKEALSAEKDLYDYQKKIAEKTKNIALLEKQLAAYAGDSSQEGQARRQKLQKDITNAKDDLRDTEYDKYIQDQQKMLDDLIGEYEERIEKKLEDFNGLLAEGITISGEQAKNTKEVLNQLASNNGYIPLKMNDFNANLKAEQGQLTAFDQYFKDVFGSGDTGKLASLVTNSNEILSSLGNGDVVNAITGINAESAFVKAIIDANSVDTQEITDAIKTIGGKTATENAEGNDPVAQAKKEQAAKEAVSSVAPAVSTASTIADIQTALTSVSAGTATAKSSINNEADIKKQANDFIKKNAKAGRANKNGKDFGPVNKQIAKFMGTEGKPLDKMKVLTTAELDDLAKMIGLKNRKDSNFEKKLKELHIAGFAHGGLVEAIKRNGDDGIATLKVGEAILTPTDSKNLASLAQKFEAIDVTADIMNMLKETAKDTGGLGTPQNIDYGGVQFNFELPNVTDSKSFINAIQSDSNLQKAIQSVSVDRINNGGRLSVNRIR